MSALKKGESITIVSGGEATVLDDKPLGSGGQGEVYRVKYKNKEFALKWYTDTDIIKNDAFYVNINNNIHDGAPDSNFVWPIYLTEKHTDAYKKKSFGYLMNIFPKGYYELGDILNTYVYETDPKTNKKKKKMINTKNVEVSIRAAINIVRAFMSLHRAGKSYQDLNHGGISVNIETGDVLICDCDNVSSTNLGIKGFPGYMAPEVLLGKNKPDMITDRFSLAVLLFKMLIRADPFWGKIQDNYVSKPGEDSDLLFYGKDPVFIFDPADTRNRPSNSNAKKFWPLFPKEIQNLFIEAFVDGVKDRNRRPTENKWFKTLMKAYTDLCICKCGKSVFNTQSKGPYVCPKCNARYEILSTDVGNAVLCGGKRLFSFNTDAQSTGDIDHPTAEVKESQKNPGVYALFNLGKEKWGYISKDKNATANSVEVGSGVRTEKILKITFTDVTINGKKIVRKGEVL